MSEKTKRKCPKCGSEEIKQHKFLQDSLWICHGCGTRLSDEIETEAKGDTKDAL